MAGNMQQSSTKATMQNKNVAGGQLALFSKDPPTGYFRDGYCRTDSSDPGNHSVAATMTSAFLDFTGSKGNNLVSKAGVKPGQKWCLCADRWKEAMDAASQGKLKESDVPRVYLHASHEKALDVVSYKDLKKFSAEGEAVGEGTRSRQDSHLDPAKSTHGSVGYNTESSGQSETTRDVKQRSL